MGTLEHWSSIKHRQQRPVPCVKAKLRLYWEGALRVFYAVARMCRFTVNRAMGVVQVMGVRVFVAIVLVWNCFVCILYGVDKHRARKQAWRVSERTLLLCAFLGGGIGALLGMLVFRHKTRHAKFALLVPLACALTIAATYALLR